MRGYAGPLLPFFPLGWHVTLFKLRLPRTPILPLFRRRLRLSTGDRSSSTAPVRLQRLLLGCSPLFYDQSANGNRERGLSGSQRIQSGWRRAAGERATAVTVTCFRGERRGIVDVISTAVGFKGRVPLDKSARISNLACEGSSFLVPINISFYLKTEQKIRGAASLSLQRGDVTNVFLPSCAISLRVTLILFTHSISALASWLSPLPEGGGDGWKQVCFQGVATKTKESAGTRARTSGLTAGRRVCLFHPEWAGTRHSCPELRAASRSYRGSSL